MNASHAEAPAPAAFLRSAVRAAARLLLGRDPTAALVRFTLAGITVAAIWLIVVVIFGYPGQIPYNWIPVLPALLFPFANIASTFLNPQVILHLLPVLAGIAGGIALAAHYLNDLFEIESLGSAFRYLLGSLFGLSYPRIRIDRQSVAQIEANNPLARVGGPGYVQTHLGFAAVFETAAGLPRVYGQSPESIRTDSPGPAAGRGAFLAGFERLRDVVDLRDRIIRLEESYAETSDGVPLTAHDIQIVFRVYGGGLERDLSNPYPYSEESIRRLVYAQPIHKSKTRTPDDLLKRITEREVHRFIRRHTLESLLALQPSAGQDESPTEELHEPETARFQIPRRALTEHFHTDALQRRLRYLGLELDWIGVGIWQLGLPASDTSRGEIDPGRTLLSAWRDYQRLRLYRTPTYLERQAAQRFRETILENLQIWLQVWSHGDLPENYRCFELLAQIERQLEKYYAHLPADERDQLPLRSVLAHLENIIRPHVLGSDGDG